jgi:predicted CxxxxCH...CXXCH cytochrome family protein
MPSIKTSHIILSAILALALCGCGNKNDKAVFSPESGHPSDWVSTHKTTARTNVESCTECHGESYDGGISRVGCMTASVAGFTCHVTSPVANLNGCISCHGNGPFGTAAPNTKSAHTKHTALPGVGCNTCHLNAGSGTAGHAKASPSGGYTKATISIPTALSTGTFGYNADKCSNVSCHGGKETPAWTTGAISIVAGNNSICLNCHEQGTTLGTPRFSPVSPWDRSQRELHRLSQHWYVDQLPAALRRYCN